MHIKLNNAPEKASLVEGGRVKLEYGIEGLKRLKQLRAQSLRHALGGLGLIARRQRSTQHGTDLPSTELIPQGQQGLLGNSWPGLGCFGPFMPVDRARMGAAPSQARF